MSKPLRDTEPMMRALGCWVRGEDPTASFTTQSEHGGFTRTVAALRRRRYLEPDLRGFVGLRPTSLGHERWALWRDAHDEELQASIKLAAQRAIALVRGAR